MMKNTKLLVAVLLIGTAVSFSYTSKTHGITSLTSPETTVSKEIPNQETKIVPFAKVMEPAFAEDYVDIDVKTEVQFIATGKGCAYSETINKYEKMKYITFRALPPRQSGEKNPLSGEVMAQYIMIPKDKSDSIFSAKTGDILIVLGRPTIEKMGDSKDVIFIATSAYKTGTETQHKAFALQTQPILENQSKTYRVSQQTQDDKKASVNTEIPLDTALRLERERLQTMFHGNKKQQINLLQVDGYEAFKKRDWNTALDVLMKKLEIDPENYSAYTNIGGIYAELNEFDKSLQYLSKANQLIPAAPAPYVFMVYVYARKGDKDRAFEALQKAVDRGYKNINHIKNDTDLPEDFRNDPRLTNFVR